MDDDKALLERLRVHELINGYVDALNHRDWDRYREYWIEKSSLSMIFESDNAPPSDIMASTTRPASVQVIGRDAIVGLVEKYNTYPWLVQLPLAVVVELLSDTEARSRQTLIVYSFALTLIGQCYDSFVKGSDGKWRFAHRDYRPTYFESVQPPGEATRKLPDFNYLNLPQIPEGA